MRNLVLFVLCFWWSYARHSEAPRKRIIQFKKLSTRFLNEQVGTSVTLNCPVRPSVVRMYRYLRRIKSGKELEHARRQMGPLLGVKYRWYKDGKPIRHHRSAWFMRLQAVQLEDAGTYTCKVAMPKHGTTRNFVLKVFKQLRNGRPILKSVSKNISLRVGESTTLTCMSRNTRRSPQANWVKLNQYQLRRLNFESDIKLDILSGKGTEYELIGTKNKDEEDSLSTRTRIQREKKGNSYEFRLMLDNVQEGDSGAYACLVRNKYGSDYRKFFVHVKSTKGQAPYPTHEILRREFMAFPAFSTARLSCYVTGDKPLIYQWYKNGKKFNNRRLSKKMNSTSSTLRIRNSLPSDSGLYTCRASNPYGVYDHNITLQIVHNTPSAPVLLKTYPQNATSSPGNTVVFKCIEIMSNPLPDYRWYKWHSVPATYPKLDFRNTSQFMEISPIHYSPIQVKFEGSVRYGGKLTLENITKDDAGLYSCVLRNQFGMDYASSFLRWKSNEGPKFVSTAHRPATIEIPPTAPLKLNCDATGEPKPKIIWSRNGMPLTQIQGIAVTNYTLTLNELAPQHSGNYTCHVENTWGSINHTFDVRIKESLFARPIIMPLPKKLLRVGERYEVRCTIVSSKQLIPRMIRELSTNSTGPETLTSQSKLVKLDKNIYQYSYVIRDATVKDSGNYSCIARNALGKSQRRFQIKVNA